MDSRSQEERLDIVSAAVSGAAEAVGPSVVQVSHQHGMGSGIVWDEAGHVLTNAHVVQGAATLRVSFPDGQRRAARVVGADSAYDLAVIETESGTSVTPARFGESDSLKPGQAVIALGNPYGLAWSVSLGVVAALERMLPTGPHQFLDGLIQTDAAINPGNSGGPLATLDGRVRGINTAMIRGAQGLAFALPSSLAMPVAEQLLRFGHARHPYIGIEGQAEIIPADWVKMFGLPTDRGVLVLGLTQGSPAGGAGILLFDLLVEVGGRPVPTPAAIRRALESVPAGQPVAVRVLRGDRVLDFQVRVGERAA
ncbi:MAG: S1C family serine protease [Clostridia bacterium]